MTKDEAVIKLMEEGIPEKKARYSVDEFVNNCTLPIEYFVKTELKANKDERKMRIYEFNEDGLLVDN